MDRIVNLDLLLNPINWVIVILMLAIAVYGLALIAAPIGQVGGLMKVV